MSSRLGAPTIRSSPLSETTSPPGTEMEAAVTVELRGHVLCGEFVVPIVEQQMRPTGVVREFDKGVGAGRP